MCEHNIFFYTLRLTSRQENEILQIYNLKFGQGGENGDEGWEKRKKLRIIINII